MANQAFNQTVLPDGFALPGFLGIRPEGGTK